MTATQTPVDALAAQARACAESLRLVSQTRRAQEACDVLEQCARALAAIPEQQAGSVPAGFVLGEYLHKFMGKGEGIVRRFYNGEDQSLVDAGAWIQEANQLFQVLAASPSTSAVQPLSEAQPTQESKDVPT